MEQVVPTSAQASTSRPGDLEAAALDWFVTLQSGAVTAAEKDAFTAWYRADPAHGAAFERIAGVAALPELQEASLAARTAPVIPLRPRRGWVRPAVAAAALVILAIGFGLYPRLLLTWTADYRTAAAQRTLPLPDGSTVLLDAGSAIALDFRAGRRDVSLLAGSAFFEVVPDSQRPFRVTAAFGTAEVKGTGFAVARETAGDRVMLAHGRLAVVGHANPGRAVLLGPGDAVAVTAAGLGPVTRPDFDQALAWRDGRLSFRDRPLADVVDALRPYRTAPIVLIGDRLAAERLSGSYRLDDPEGALRSLAAAVGGRLQELPGGILILR